MAAFPALEDAEARTDRTAYDEQWVSRMVLPSGAHVAAGDHATMSALAPHVLAARIVAEPDVTATVSHGS